MNTCELKLKVPDEIDASVRQLKETVFSRNSVEEIYQILLWRGLERTSRLISCKEKNTINDKEKREMVKKEIRPDQSCHIELENGISLSVDKQNQTAWCVSAKIELQLDEYKNVMSHGEAEFIAESLIKKYSRIDLEELLQLSE